MDLPANLKAAIEARAAGLPTGDLIRSARTMTELYRDQSGRGKRLVTGDTDVLAYAIVRMPATYGAVSSALAHALHSAQFPLRRVLDAGAGVGTAAWAVAGSSQTVQQITCLEREPAMIALGRSLMAGQPPEPKVRWVRGDLRDLQGEATYDLVIASYSLNELSEPERRKAVEALWRHAAHMLLIVEPGTPAAFAQICQARRLLTQLGGFVAAPCPHGDDCPLEGGDWCHFTCRVARSRLHKQLKNADVPYEDEKYCFLAVTRAPAAPGAPRVLRHPQIASGRITLTLCTPGGIETRSVTKKDKEAFRAARKAKCGDLVPL